MSEYKAKITWHRQIDEEFVQSKYSRGHEWFFDGGTTIPASSSPHIVPLPYSVEANVDPEEAFVAALSSCHMLFVFVDRCKEKVCGRYIY
jgi:organic hydroperoxide reductase OsmC/OhrA